MKKLRLITKTLLVAAMLLGGTNAWAQTTAFSQDFTDKTPTSTNVEDYGFTASTSDASCTATVEEGRLKLFVAANGNKDWNSTATATFTPIGEGNVITFSCAWNPGGPTGTRPYTHLRLTDANGNAALSLSNNGQTRTLFINGDENTTAASGNDWRSGEVVWNVVATLNMSTRKIETLMVTKSGDTTPVVNQTNIAFQNDVTSISKLVCQTTKKANWTVTSYLDDVSITYEAAASVANLTFKYEDDEGNSLSSLKADVVESHTVGDAIAGLISSSLTASFKNVDESIRYDFNTYTVSDDATTIPAGGATITLKFTPKTKYTYIVNAVQNEDKTKTIKQIANGYVYAGDNVTIPYPHYLNVNGKLYTRGTTSNEYRKNITPSKDGHVEQFPYTASETVANLVFLSEGEDIVGTTSYNGGNVVVRASNAKVGDHSGNLTITQLPAGTYKLTAGIFRTSSSSTETAKFTIGDNEISLTANNVNLNEISSDEFTITSLENIVWDGGSRLDYIYIAGTPTNEIVGALDFSTTANGAHSADYTLKQGETKVFTFQNHGTTFGNNWRIEVKQGDTWKANVCADSYDYTAGSATNVTSYKESKDNGATQVGINWDDYSADMADARVVATLTYDINGTLAIRTTSTGSANGYIYYVDHDVTGLSGDITINLSVCNSWLEILSVENTAVSATIAASGYTTLSSAYGLDFTNVNGLTAYVVSNITKDAVTISSVEEMPANNGIVLKGTPSTTYSIPVKADAAFSRTNKLQAAVDATLVENGTAYILKGGKFCLLTEAATEADRTIPAGKAYLLATDVPNEARTLGFVFDDELTGINNVNVNNNVNGEFYDLQGRRVAAPQKGMYIMNGRKVIVK